MEKKIEDYLHLYLGCKCKYKGDTGIMYEVTTHGCRIAGVFGGGFIGFGLCKPLLRPLSDMSEEEKKEINVSNPSTLQFCTSKQFAWLLSKHFDLFGLHEAGVCLYKNDKNELY